VTYCKLQFTFCINFLLSIVIEIYALFGGSFVPQDDRLLLQRRRSLRLRGIVLWGHKPRLGMFLFIVLFCLSKKERKKDLEKRCSAVFLGSLDVVLVVLRDGLLEFDCTRCVCLIPLQICIRF